MTDIFEAARGKQVNVIEGLCLRNGYDQLTKKDKNGKTALHHCAGLGHEEVLDFILQQCIVDVNAEDKQGMTAMHHAAFNGRAKFLEMIGSRGGELNARSKKDNTPLHEAAINGHLHCVQWLVEHSAQLNAVNKNGDTPRDAANRNKQQEVVDFLDSAAQPVDRQELHNIVKEEVSLAFTGQIERLEARIAMLEARISQPTPERARNCTVRRHNPLGKADAGVVVTVDASMDFPLFKMRCGDALGVTCAKLRKADSGAALTSTTQVGDNDVLICTTDDDELRDFGRGGQ